MFKTISIPILILLMTLSASAQVSIERYVLSSLGNAGVTQNGGTLTHTAGEAVIQTITDGNFTLTQGFHQDITGSIPFPLTVDTLTTRATCPNLANGFVQAELQNGVAPFQWKVIDIFTNDVAAEASSEDQKIEFDNLPIGSYKIEVTDNDNEYGATAIFSIKADVSENNGCDGDLKIWSGFTPDGNGTNDTWEIDGIENFEDNTVTIYDRWGGKVWERSGYRNDQEAFKGLDKNGAELPDGTYFYIIELPSANEKMKKGWVHILRPE